jgi:WD40 repeat protein
MAEPLPDTLQGPPATEAATARQAASAPRRLGDYELLEEIGHGCTGVVYRARQTSAGREVALKVILGGPAASATEAERFRRESQAIAALDHPNIVPIYEVGTHAGQHYFSMKWCRGGTLAEHCAGFQADWLGTAEVMTAVARAVHHAHERGILHRDLKPSNILLEAGTLPDDLPTPYVSDFGLAKRLDGDPTLSSTGAILGTPGYMSPEQAAGKKDLSPAADVYGLGAILYELLTGRPPFQCESLLAALQQAGTQEPPRPRSLRRDIPRDLETICRKCLNKRPARRYESAAALAEDLENWLHHRPISVRRPGPVGMLRRLCPRAPLVPALALIVAALLVLVVVSAAVQRVQSRQLARYQSDMDEAMKDLGTGDVDQVQEILARHDFPLWLAWADYRDERWQTVQDWCLAHRTTIRELPSDALVWSPRGTWLMSCRGFGADRQPAAGEEHPLKIWPSSGGGPGLTLDLRAARPGSAPADWDGHATDVAWSPDERRLALSGPRGLELWDLTTGTRLWQAPASGMTYGGAFSPDGSALATLSDVYPSRLVVWNTADGRELYKTALPPGTMGQREVRLVGFSPDGRWVALVQAPVASPEESDLCWFVPLDGGPATRVETTPERITGNAERIYGRGDRWAAWSQDGRRLAVATAVWTRAHTDVVRLRDGTTRRVWHSIVGNGRTEWIDGTWGPDHVRTVICDVSGAQPVVVCSENLPIVNGRGRARALNVAVTWSADGTRLITPIGRVCHVWDAATGKKAGERRFGEGLIPRSCQVFWSPDGSRVATVHAAGDKGALPIANVWEATPELTTATGPAN